MFQSVRLALRRQKKLLLIFLLTIFLPSVTLSIFGLIALRNERYRLEKQIREEQQESINYIKSQINKHLLTLEQELQYLVRMPPFISKDYAAIIDLVEAHLEMNLLSEQLFMLYQGNQPWFPPFRGEGSGYIQEPQLGFTVQQQKKLEQADRYEFSQKDFKSAINELEELLEITNDHCLKGQLLNMIARNQMKQNNFDEAIRTYSKIIRDFPDTKTSSGTILPVSVRFQLVECYLGSGLYNEAIQALLQASDEIMRNFHQLSNHQFSAYVSMAREKLFSIRNEFPEAFTSDTLLTREFEILDTRCLEKMNIWHTIANLKDECLDEIFPGLMESAANTENTYRYVQKIGSEDYLIISSVIPGINDAPSRNFAGIKLSNTFLEDSILSNAINTSGRAEDFSLLVTDLNGRVINGIEPMSGETSGIISVFEDNFPPWRIEALNHPSRPPLLSGILRSYYFWAVLSMMGILVFGIIITGRTISHEKEVLKLKSDFVSSVSHEFKTPISSIKALSERLLEDDVKEKERMREYYSVINREADNLSHLVGNILDLSSMEEGKRKYNMKETHFLAWHEQTVSAFFRKLPRRRFTFRSDISVSSLLVKMDEQAMQLAVNNLLDNAVKFSSDESEITLALETQGNNLLVKITDGGQGIPPEEQGRIFEKFYRVQSISTQSVTGSGLGLSIVKQVVEAHRGEVRVNSATGIGSTFTIILPIEPETKGHGQA